MSNLERRQWIKKGLGAIGAMGLGGLVLSGCERFRRNQAGPPPWRAEKVFIFPEEVKPEEVKEGEKEGRRWIVSPGRKPVSRGEVVTWRAFGFSDKVTLTLPAEVFEDETVTIVTKGGLGRSRVKQDAKEGFYPYHVKSDGQLAHGGSYPRVIVDG
ncbi:MAG: hypothetical protein V3U28_03620 [Candidatus Acidoferrales bacterium]